MSKMYSIWENVLLFKNNTHYISSFFPFFLVGCDTLTFQQESYQLVYRNLSDSRGQRAAVEINLQAQLRVYMQ